MDLIYLFEYDDIFNYFMRFVNVIIDINSMILVNKKLYKLIVHHELFQNYMKLLKSPKMNMYQIDNGTPQYHFMKACHYGNLLYKNIIDTNKINIHTNNEYAFRRSCSNGYLEVAKWLIELSRSDGFTLIDIHAHDEYAFRWSCENGHIEVAKWLIELSRSEGFYLIDIHATNEFAFRSSCKSGHLEVAKWLIELSQSDGFTLIDIHANNEYAFRGSCSNGHLGVAKWLIELSHSNVFTPIPQETINKYLKN